MVTIADVAKLAGLSTGTVSRVMNESENVSEESRKKVNHAIATLGYKPNLQARSLRRQRTDTIALAIPELTNDYWTSIIRGVQDVCQSKGYHVLICHTEGKRGNYLSYLEVMANRVDGMILSRSSERSVARSTGKKSAKKSNSSHEKPIVFVGQSQASSWNIDNVYSDSIAGAFTLTQHLIQLGHQNIAIVTGRKSSTSASNRVAGYCMALADAKIPIDTQMICWGEYSRKTSEILTQDLIQRLPQTTAIFAANNEIAIGVINALGKLDLQVPQSIAVVCFDDFYPDSRFASLMTVASQSPYDIGLNAAQLLINRLNGNEHLRPQTIMLPPRLIIRQSCGGDPSPIRELDDYDNVQGQLILPLPQEKMRDLAGDINSVIEMKTLINNDNTLKNISKQMIDHDRFTLSFMSHFEYAITSRALYQYVLERKPSYEVVGQTKQIIVEDQVEFAQRSNITMIPCRFPYQPTLSHLNSTWAKDTQPHLDVPFLSDHLDLFDRFVRATGGTNGRIVGDFRGIVADTLRIYENLYSIDNDIEETVLEDIIDELLGYQTKVIQLVCDRFATNLAFVIFSDHIADNKGLSLPLDKFEALFSERIQRLIHPAKEHNLQTVLYSNGKLNTLPPLIQQLGFDGIYIAQPELCNLTILKKNNKGNLSILGGIPVSALIDGTSLDHIQSLNTLFGANGGYIGGVSSDINDDIPVESYLSFINALS